MTQQLETRERTKHATGTRKEWLAARLDLLKAETEHSRRGDEMAERRQALPWVRVDKTYRFDTGEGSAARADLFRGRSQLLVYHFMFGPDYTASCPACSAIADGFNGFATPLANHDVMFWAISRAPLAKLQSSPSSSSAKAGSSTTTSASRPWSRAPREARFPRARHPTGPPRVPR